MIESVTSPVLDWFAQLPGSEQSLAVIAIAAGILLAFVLLLSLLVYVRRQRAALAQREQSLLSAAQHESLLREQLDAMAQQLQQGATSLAVEQRTVNELRQRLDAAELQAQSLQTSLGQSQVSFAELEARSASERRASEEKLQLLQKNREQLTADFENLANRIFNDKQQRFSESSQQLLDLTLKPLRQQLGEFRERVDTAYATEAKERHLLKEQIAQLHSQSARLSDDATNLAQALRHDNKAQGNWGELSLVRALELCGLREPEEFETQVVMKGQDGRRQIPDVMVHLPGGREVIIDSKVSLLAYTRYFEAEDNSEREAALQAHISSIRTHIKELSEKDYGRQLGVNTLEYVMLYIPIEGASALALQQDRQLWSDAYQRNIVLVSPTNLLAILRSVETIWRHERQNKNAEKIAVDAGRLYDQFARYAESLEEVGKGLDRAQSAYSNARNRLVEGRGNLLRRIEGLRELGARVSKDIPQAIRDADHLDAEPLEGNTEETAASDAASLETLHDEH